jgi:SAM-dependent methyltransferase
VSAAKEVEQRIGANRGPGHASRRPAGAPSPGRNPPRERARERTAALPQVRLVQGDAAHVELPRRFDALFSRFGVMFFRDPLAAFTRLRSALEPGGRLTFLCWQPIERNAWVMDLMKELRELLPPAPPLSPTGPGAFSLGDATGESFSAKARL